MRATLEIGGTVMAAAEKAAADRSMSVDELVANLLHRALFGPGTVVIGRRADSGFPVGYSPASLPPITPELIRRNDEEDEEDVRRTWPKPWRGRPGFLRDVDVLVALAWRRHAAQPATLDAAVAPLPGAGSAVEVTA